MKKSVGDLCDEIIKSGEGSRGGKIVGHTKSGRAIYGRPASFSHRGHTVSYTNHPEGMKMTVSGPHININNVQSHKEIKEEGLNNKDYFKQLINQHLD